MLSHPEIKDALFGCTTLALLQKSLTGPHCQGASQLSLKRLSAHVSSYLLCMMPSMSKQDLNICSVEHRYQLSEVIKQDFSKLSRVRPSTEGHEGGELNDSLSKIALVDLS